MAWARTGWPATIAVVAAPLASSNFTAKVNVTVGVVPVPDPVPDPEPVPGSTAVPASLPPPPPPHATKADNNSPPSAVLNFEKLIAKLPNRARR
jgi:hypothetical protein